MSVPQTIGGASEALDFLANRWKGSRRKHAFAREICAAAVSGMSRRRPRARLSFRPLTKPRCPPARPVVVRRRQDEISSVK
ncbi:DUF982 domain-containing protein [Rhizobium sp. 814_E9_N1_1]|uniref:DUF982 domain-containing protein n=1 Tax=unclassified Rhizobium TaxID=2613769 RepID=UPI003F1FB5BF